ncbi:Histone acetyltransferase HPA2 and related acetyltransferases (chromatophore) [Paulinella micropora]|uniref:Histone acetyltransferase HPA2 and related acetyltransferases n=1 Tax=Paulinella micropora TaxID=1928728 RepID=A0A1L5YCZ1_9EUKA|nr:hypothetical protein PCKR_814 [Paulinella micropora]AQX45342.1 hypothetical protein PFK_814 [Paulinella micropora]BBL86561.1 Histone acetyltransferase HPA2 and related acetyltransferases [Paulinella micropora]
MSTYYFVAASERFLTETDRLEEVLQERLSNYTKIGRPIDFWLIRNPKFLQSHTFKLMIANIPGPIASIVSTDAKFIEFLKLRLEFVVKGTFETTPNTSNHILSSVKA